MIIRFARNTSHSILTVFSIVSYIKVRDVSLFFMSMTCPRISKIFFFTSPDLSSKFLLVTKFIIWSAPQIHCLDLFTADCVRQCPRLRYAFAESPAVDACSKKPLPVKIALSWLLRISSIAKRSPPVGNVPSTPGLEMESGLTMFLLISASRASRDLGQKMLRRLMALGRSLVLLGNAISDLGKMSKGKGGDI